VVSSTGSTGDEPAGTASAGEGQPSNGESAGAMAGTAQPARAWTPQGWQPRVALGVVGVLVIGAAATGIAVGTRHSSATPSQPVLLTSFSCGANWHSARPGPQTIVLHNEANNPMDEVDLIDPRSGKVFAELENMGAGTISDVQVVLGNGEYAWRCLPDDLDGVTGPAVTVTGATQPGTPGVVPLTKADLIEPTLTYQREIGAGLEKLKPEVGALRTDIADGDLTAARGAWLTAHMRYETLGGAYDAFGDLGDAIDGLDDGLPAGADDKDFTGFHRIEYGLWHGQSAKTLLPYANKLVADVDSLSATWPQQQIDPNDLGLRAHEILEDAIRFELSGNSDMGSGTNLATMYANLEGTRTVLAVIAPFARSRYPQLNELYSWLDRLANELQAQDHDGTWTPVEKLSLTQREQLDSTTSECVELLSPIAEIFDVRRTS
jgi:iron uptake system component EfeO